MSDFSKQEVHFGFRMAIFGLKLSCLGTLSPAVQERDWIDQIATRVILMVSVCNQSRVLKSRERRDPFVKPACR